MNVELIDKAYDVWKETTTDKTAREHVQSYIDRLKFMAILEAL